MLHETGVTSPGRFSDVEMTLVGNRLVDTEDRTTESGRSFRPHRERGSAGGGLA